MTTAKDSFDDRAHIGPNLELERIQIDRDKVRLEEQRFALEKKWKIYAAVGAVLSAAMTFVAATNLVGFGRTSSATESSASVTLDRSNDFLASGSENRFGAFLSAAKRDVWMVGTSFHISADTFRTQLLQAVQRGVSIHFLIMDPASPALTPTSQMLETSETEIKAQSLSTISLLASMVKESKSTKSSSSGVLAAKLASEPLMSRMYFFDPKSSDGATYYVPYVNRMNSQNLPGFLVYNKHAKFHEQYFLGVQKLWSSSGVTDLEDWLKVHPGR